MSGDMSMIGANALYTAASGKSSAFSLLQYAGIDQGNIIDSKNLLGSYGNVMELARQVGMGWFDAGAGDQFAMGAPQGSYVMGANMGTGVGGGNSAGGGLYGSSQPGNYIMGVNVTA